MKDFTHPLEHKYFRRLNDNWAFRTVTGAFGQFYSNVTDLAEVPDRCLTVTPSTFPRLFEMYRQAKRRLELTTDYPIFCMMDYRRTARVIGTDDNCALVVNSACVEDFDDVQLTAMFGVMLGHIKLRHVTCITMLDMIDSIRMVPQIAKDAAKSFLLDWLLTAEYSADRAGAIAAGGIDAVIRNHLMASGFETSEQCNAYDLTTPIMMPQELDTLDNAAKVALIRTLRAFPIPFATVRIRMLTDWSVSEACRRDFPELYREDLSGVTTPTFISIG